MSGVMVINPATQFASGARVLPPPGSPPVDFDVVPGPVRVQQNVLVNQDGSNNPQNEPAIAVDPNNDSRLVASSNDYRDFTPRCGLYASTDRGSSWRDVAGGLMPATGTSYGGDPSVAFDASGNAYWACLGFTPGFNQDAWKSQIMVVRSTDLRTIQMVHLVIVDQPGTGGYVNDKPYMTIDTRPASPHRGRIYVTWTRYQYKVNAYQGAPIMIAYSDDGGATWSPPHPVTPLTLPDNQGSVPAVGPDGTLYVVFENFDTPTIVNQQMVAKSTDGGQTFAPPVKAADVLDICPRVSDGGRCSLLNSDFRVNSFPSIAVSPTRGTVFVTWGDYRFGNADVLLTRSIDAGATWSPPLEVNDDNTSNDQFFPWITVAKSGAVHVDYYDRRFDPYNYLIDVSLSTSTTNGESFAPSVRVTSSSSDPSIQFGGTFIGDYIGLASDAAAHPIWTDTRRIVYGSRNQDIMTSQVYGPWSSAPAAIVARLGPSR
jgi:hypothetical protein